MCSNSVVFIVPVSIHNAQGAGSDFESQISRVRKTKIFGSRWVVGTTPYVQIFFIYENYLGFGFNQNKFST